MVEGRLTPSEGETLELRRIRMIVGAVLALLPGPSLAQSAPGGSTPETPVLLRPPNVLAQAAAVAPVPQTETVLPTVEVIATTPLLGSGVDRNKVPAQSQVLTRRDITRDGNADALRALNEQVPGVTLDAAAG